MTTTPTDLELCFGYMRDFEIAFATGDWSLVERHFHDDATHRIEGGGPPIGSGGDGRAAVVAGLAGGVDAIDRRFDLRLPEIVEGPETRPDGIWMRFELALRRRGVPELRIRGEHLATYRDGRIASLRERVEPGSAGRVAAFLAEHDAALKPAGSPPSFPGEAADLRALEEATGRSLVRCYGRAKSEQDTGAALAVCDDGFRIETVSFGIASRDRDDTRGQLGAFFSAFPDYAVSLDGFASSPGIVTCWGRARLTLGGDFLGVRATGKTADVPIFCVFELAGPALASERFFFDKADLCRGIGVPVAAIDASLAALREAGMAA